MNVGRSQPGRSKNDSGFSDGDKRQQPDGDGVPLNARARRRQFGRWDGWSDRNSFRRFPRGLGASAGFGSGKATRRVGQYIWRFVNDARLLAPEVEELDSTGLVFVLASRRPLKIHRLRWCPTLRPIGRRVCANLPGEMKMLSHPIDCGSDHERRPIAASLLTRRSAGMWPGSRFSCDRPRQFVTRNIYIF